MPVYLQDSLIFAPRLEEASSTRRDESGRGWHLTPTGTPARAAGKRGYGVSLARASDNGQRLGVTGVTDLNGLSQLWMAVWAKPTGLPADTYAALGITLSSGSKVYSLDYNTNGTWFLRYFTATSGALSVITSTIYPAAWTLVQGWLDVSGGVVGVQVNDDAPVTAALPSMLQVDGGQIYVGARDATTPGSTGRTFDGLLDCPFIWRKAPSAEERAAVWNNGAGVEWPFLPLGVGSPLTLPTAWGAL